MGRTKEREYVNTSVNIDKELYEAVSEYMRENNLSTRVSVIEKSLRAFLSLEGFSQNLVRRDRFFKEAIDKLWDLCNECLCSECPIQETCARIFPNGTLREFATIALNEIHSKPKERCD